MGQFDYKKFEKAICNSIESGYLTIKTDSSQKCDHWISLTSNEQLFSVRKRTLCSSGEIQYILRKGFDAGKLLSLYFNSDGTVRLFEIGDPQVDGSLVVLFNRTGRIKEYQYINSDSLGRWGYGIKWYDNGVLFEEYLRDSSEYLFKSYHKNGNVKVTSKFNNIEMLFVGPFFEYYENGRIKIYGEHMLSNLSLKAGVRNNYFGIRTGKWLYWNEHGKLIKEVQWKDGVEINTSVFK